MATAILHIGTPKTATTSLQAFLYRNRTLLKEEGFLFPLCWNSQAHSNVTQNGSFLVFLDRTWPYLKVLWHAAVGIKNGRIAWGIGRVTGISRLHDIRQLESIGREGKNVILTEENLSILNDAQIMRIGEFIRGCGFDDVRIVMYVRPHDEMLLSQWKQMCKSGYGTQSFDECVEYIHRYPYSDYSWVAERYERAFGEGSVRIRRFSKEFFEGGCIERDFCQTAGIPWREDYSAAATFNTSLTCDVAEAMLRITLDGFPTVSSLFASPERRRLMEIADELSAELGEAPGTYPIGPDERRALLESFREGNERLSERYLGGEPFPARPFDEDYPIWQPDEERISSIVDELLTRYRQSR